MAKPTREEIVRMTAKMTPVDKIEFMEALAVKIFGVKEPAPELVAAARAAYLKQMASFDPSAQLSPYGKQAMDIALASLRAQAAHTATVLEAALTPGQLLQYIAALQEGMRVKQGKPAPGPVLDTGAGTAKWYLN